MDSKLLGSDIFGEVPVAVPRFRLGQLVYVLEIDGRRILIIGPSKIDSIEIRREYETIKDDSFITDENAEGHSTRVKAVIGYTLEKQAACVVSETDVFESWGLVWSEVTAWIKSQGRDAL